MLSKMGSALNDDVNESNCDFLGIQICVQLNFITPFILMTFCHDENFLFAAVALMTLPPKTIPGKPG